ncbi:MAG TPA: pitrilysin family protein, partial [Pyrinomonadaceae bacterium]|nr:pitrilysin family protein [Pyrinomonadaceae bacterium]
ASAASSGAIADVLLPSRSPLVSFRLLFMTGAASDPAGKEGLAALTAAMLAQGGSASMPYDRILEAMYPMASGFGAQVDKEMTVFTGTAHVENLERYYALISQMLLDPGFREDDFTRVKTNAINFLKVNLRQANDEELGKEHLYNVIYQNHVYGHHNAGRVSSLEKLTLDDVRDFYRQHYTQANLVVGLAGGYPSSFPRQVVKDFSRLPKGEVKNVRVGGPTVPVGTRVEIIKRDTRSTAISLGFPIPVNRAHKDFAALSVAASYFGQHRNSNSYLYQRIREARGLNYGDYAYIEYFPRGMFQSEPDANLGRQSQIFQIWIRPVEPQNGLFTLRAALYEHDRLVKNGMSREDFETTREFLSKYVNILTSTQNEQLGYALDSRYYGTGNFNEQVRRQLAALTLEDVNRAIRQHLKTDRMQIVLVTKDAEDLRRDLLGGKPSPVTYTSPKPKEITDEDKIIEAFKINVRPENVRVVPVEQVFE